MHYYQFNIADYRKSTQYLTLLEHAIYRALLDTYYLDESPLCGDDAKLMRLHGIRTDEEKAAYHVVIGDFFTLKDGKYHHEKCDRVLSKIYDKSEKARASALKRWERNANASKTQIERNASGMLPITHYPLPITQEPIKENIGGKPPVKSKRFAEPSLIDVQNYFLEKTDDKQLSAVEGAKFHSFYESKGWHVGKNKMKDWRAAVRSWISRLQPSKQGFSKQTMSSINNIIDLELK